jgi:spore coat protein U-like protein
MAMSAAPVLAGSASQQFNVKATVNDKCLIKTGPAEYDFGIYDPTVATDNDTGAGSAVIKCTKGTAATITLSNPALTNGTDTLTYSWFREAGRTTAFGSLVYNSVSNADHTVDFFGRISALQDVGSGAYSNNTATFTVSY